MSSQSCDWEGTNRKGQVHQVLVKAEIHWRSREEVVPSDWPQLQTQWTLSQGPFETFLERSGVRFCTCHLPDDEHNGRHLKGLANHELDCLALKESCD